MLSPKAIPMHNPVSTLVYSSSMKNIESVIVDGNIIMEDSKILTANEEKALKDAQDTAERLCIRGTIKIEWKVINGIAFINKCNLFIKSIVKL